MNLTVILYILIIFCGFFFRRPDADIFFFWRGGGSYSFLCFIILRGLFGTASHNNLCISVNVMRHQMQFLTFIC